MFSTQENNNSSFYYLTPLCSSKNIWYFVSVSRRIKRLDNLYYWLSDIFYEYNIRKINYLINLQLLRK